MTLSFEATTVSFSYKSIQSVLYAHCVSGSLLLPLTTSTRQPFQPHRKHSHVHHSARKVKLQLVLPNQQQIVKVYFFSVKALLYATHRCVPRVSSSHAFHRPLSRIASHCIVPATTASISSLHRNDPSIDNSGMEKQKLRTTSSSIQAALILRASVFGVGGVASLEQESRACPSSCCVA